MGRLTVHGKTFGSMKAKMAYLRSLRRVGPGRSRVSKTGRRRRPVYRQKGDCYTIPYGKMGYRRNIRCYAGRRRRA